MNAGQVTAQAPCVCEVCPSSVRAKHDSEIREKIRLFLPTVLPGSTTLAELEMIEARFYDVVATQWKPAGGGS